MPLRKPIYDYTVYLENVKAFCFFQVKIVILQKSCKNAIIHTNKDTLTLSSDTTINILQQQKFGRKNHDEGRKFECKSTDNQR